MNTKDIERIINRNNGKSHHEWARKHKEMKAIFYENNLIMKYSNGKNKKRAKP